MITVDRVPTWVMDQNDWLAHVALDRKKRENEHAQQRRALLVLEMRERAKVLRGSPGPGDIARADQLLLIANVLERST